MLQRSGMMTSGAWKMKNPTLPPVLPLRYSPHKRRGCGAEVRKPWPRTWNEIGINMIWLPPAQRASGGFAPVGADSHDLTDLRQSSSQKAPLPRNMVIKPSSRCRRCGLPPALRYCGARLIVVVSLQDGRRAKKHIRACSASMVEQDRTFKSRRTATEVRSTDTLPSRSEDGAVLSGFICGTTKCFQRRRSHRGNPGGDGDFTVGNLQLYRRRLPSRSGR